MIEIDKATCDECATCVSVCPVDAIILGPHVTIDNEKCISCGRCVAVCPVGALTNTMQAGASKEGNRE
jgi:hypothetical protein